MIFLNARPVINHPDYPSEIILTDDGTSKVSIIYMDKRYAPKSKELAHLTVTNPDFNPSEEESDDNRKYTIEQWMYVERIFSNSYPKTTLFDEEGDPILNEDGSVFLGNWDEIDGIVKVHLREHKYVLRRNYCLNNVNMVSQLPMFLNAHNSLKENIYENYMDWQELMEFLSNPEWRIAFTYDEESLDNPPAVPRNCFWEGLTLLSCAQDLALNFNLRYLSKVITRPTDPDYDDDGISLTEISYVRKKRIEYDDTICYEKIDWPVSEASRLIQEKQTDILFPQNYTTGYRYYIHGKEFTTVDDYAFICNLFPYYGEEVEDDTLMQMMSDYLREGHINVDTYYEFTTRKLPADFYDTKEWSSIRIVIEGTAPIFHVKHEPKDLLRAVPRENPTNVNILFQGVVLAATDNSITLANVTDLTNNVVYENPKIISYPNIDTMTANQMVPNTGDLVTYGISNNKIAVVSVAERAPYPEEQVRIQYQGSNVNKVTWTCPGWSFNLADSYFTHPEVGTYPELMIYNYQYVSHDIVEGSEANFNTIDYVTTTEADYYQNIVAGVGSKARITLRSVATLDNVKDYIKRFVTFNRPMKDSIIELAARDWLRNYQYVQVYVGLSDEFTMMECYYSHLQGTSRTNGMGIHPDLLPEFFTRITDAGIVSANTFPYTWATGYTPTHPVSYFGRLGSASLLNDIQRHCGYGYQKRFGELSTTVSITLG